MPNDVRHYAKGTSLTSAMPWGLYISARAVCPDGRVRACTPKACADTFWTIPAKLTCRKKTVSGFLTFASESGLSTDPEQWLKFVPTGKHKDIFEGITHAENPNA